MQQAATIWQHTLNACSTGIVLLPVLISLCLTPLTAQSATEPQVKVAFLYQFTQFTEWPATAFDSSNPGFRICVLGDALPARLLRPLTGKTHNKLTISIAYPQSASEMRACHLLYINTDNRREAAILKKYKNTPLLTVSSQPGFITRGGMIGFVIVDGRLRLEINRAAARRANIKLSAQLLEVAIIVKDIPSREQQP